MRLKGSAGTGGCSRARCGWYVSWVGWSEETGQTGSALGKPSLTETQWHGPLGSWTSKALPDIKVSLRPRARADWSFRSQWKAAYAGWPHGGRCIYNWALNHCYPFMRSVGFQALQRKRMIFAVVGLALSLQELNVLQRAGPFKRQWVKGGRWPFIKHSRLEWGGGGDAEMELSQAGAVERRRLRQMGWDGV